ncbi:Cytochrome P450, E-class, group I [Parasponia andersonii]|uniref:Cytochrome P450, E-class, group I n=1 Tax=Parasponia andersonii TaxID=3476 RepID=A0A2P5CTC4_PARAD|nr:Cytochrome P450, E-class, group I [Parasponia andersonii]
MLLHLGDVPVLVISSTEAAKVVLKIHDLNSCSRPSLLGARRLTYNYKDLAFLPYGQLSRALILLMKIPNLDLVAEATIGGFCVVKYFPYVEWSRLNSYLYGPRKTTTGRNHNEYRPSSEEARHKMELELALETKEKLPTSDTDQLQYLKMIVKETLRLHPPAPMLLPRQTISHFKLNGFDIQPKTILQVNAWAIRRDPDTWKDPEEFIPERFMDSTIDFKGLHFELLPFGSGRQACPAIYMGTTTVELGLANLFYHFDWKLPDGTKEQDINMEEVLFNRSKLAIDYD